MTDTSSSLQNHLSQFKWAGYLIGFSLGGFFDGILLHQILQWHHLLTNVSGEFFRSIEIQILADGLFHVLMYFVAIGGLWLLWKGRHQYSKLGADKNLLGNALIGFGAWHLLDGVLSHWVLGIHHIRSDSENILMWDLLWFFVFGVAFVLLGWKIRSSPASKNEKSGPGKATVVSLVLATLIAGPVSAIPPKDSSTALVFFKAGTTPKQIFTAINSTDARILWANDTGNIWALNLNRKNESHYFYKHGAYLVSNSVLAMGCLAWSVSKEV